jgi:hypothetical protein
MSLNYPTFNAIKTNHIDRAGDAFISFDSSGNINMDAENNSINIGDSSGSTQNINSTGQNINIMAQNININGKLSISNLNKIGTDGSSSDKLPVGCLFLGAWVGSDGLDEVFPGQIVTEGYNGGTENERHMEALWIKLGNNPSNPAAYYRQRFFSNGSTFRCLTYQGKDTTYNSLTLSLWVRLS